MDGGAVAIVVVLALFPLVVTISTVFIAMMLGHSLNREAVASHPESELIATNY